LPDGSLLRRTVTTIIVEIALRPSVQELHADLLISIVPFVLVGIDRRSSPSGLDRWKGTDGLLWQIEDLDSFTARFWAVETKEENRTPDVETKGIVSMRRMSIFCPLTIALFLTIHTVSWAQQAPPVNTVEINPSDPIGGTLFGGPSLAPGASGNKDTDGEFSWLRVPRQRQRFQSGYFFIYPDGPGYYSLWDQLTGNFRQGPPAFPYVRNGLDRTPFFEYSFAYLDRPDNTEHHFLDPLKRIHLGDNWLLGFGGEFRVRTVNETDYQGNKAGIDSNVQTTRARLYADLWYRDIFRVYAEGIDARVYNIDVPPSANDQNHFDLLNMFIQVKTPWFELGKGDFAYLRIGRQELVYGSLRLISTSDFSNAHNTFQGVKFLSHGQKYDFDVFVVQPIIHDVNHFDSVDDKRTFSVAWFTYRPVEGQVIDLYNLDLSDGNLNATGRKGIKGGFNLNTIGSRYYGTAQGFMWDFEGGVQFGEWVNQAAVAGFYTLDAGYAFKNLPLLPQFWVGYDWASGGNDTVQTHHTFNQLFPSTHNYLGQADIVGRQNIQDISCQFAFFPTYWWTAYIQFHDFHLANDTDALYNKSGNAIRQDASGRSGGDVGRELDLFSNFHLSNHMDLQTGYSHFYGGRFMAATGKKDIDFYYIQYNYRF
jgi:Alginate export